MHCLDNGYHYLDNGNHYLDIKSDVNAPLVIPSVCLLFTEAVPFNVAPRTYLHKLLTRSNIHWTNKMLYHLKESNLGWAKSMMEKLHEYELEDDWDKIRSMSKNQWKTIVEEAVDEVNRKKQITNCTSVTPEGLKINKKTKSVHKQLTTPSYKRQPLPEIINGNRLWAKTITMARHGMIECGTNFKGTMPETCKACQTTDNENHRLNECISYANLNLADTDAKCNFDDVFSQDSNTLKLIISQLDKVWDFRYTNGRMKKNE